MGAGGLRAFDAGGSSTHGDWLTVTRAAALAPEPTCERWRFWPRRGRLQKTRWSRCHHPEIGFGMIGANERAR